MEWNGAEWNVMQLFIRLLVIIYLVNCIDGSILPGVWTNTGIPRSNNAGSKRLTKGNVMSASMPAMEPFTAIISGSKVPGVGFMAVEWGTWMVGWLDEFSKALDFCFVFQYFGQLSALEDHFPLWNGHRLGVDTFFFWDTRHFFAWFGLPTLVWYWESW